MKKFKTLDVLKIILKNLPQTPEVTDVLANLALDVKFIDLPAISSQQLSDLFAVSANGTGSYKETREQLLTFIAQNITLQNTYDASGSSPAIQLGIHGYFIKDPIGNTLLSFSTIDDVNFATELSSQTLISLQNLTNNGVTEFDGQSIINFVPTAFSANSPSFTFTAKSTVTGHSQATAGNYEFGFSDTSSSFSGFFKLFLSDQGILDNILYGIATTSGNIPHVGIAGQLVVGIPYGSSTNKNALLELNSTIQGFLPTSLSTAQEATLTALLGGGDSGLSWYNNSIGVQTYWDGSNRQRLLAVDKIIEGANMAITKNSDGSVVFASSGGGGLGTQVQGTFTTSAGSPTSVGATDTPINLGSPLYFNVINSVGTNVNPASVGGVNTAIIQNASAGGRWGIARFDLTMSFSTSGTDTFAFTVYSSATGATTFFKNDAITFTPGLNKSISFCSPLIFLDTNDFLYLTVSCASGSGTFTARTFQASWVDTTVASIPGSGALPQTGNNWYASQDGGVTFQNIASSLVPGNLVAANTVGGQLIDSGIPIISLPASGNWSPVLTNNAGISGSISVVSSRYALIGNILIITQNLSFTATDSDVEFTTDLPTAINFTATTKASLMGQSLVTAANNPTDGIVSKAAAIVSSNTIKISATVTVGSGTKYLQYSAMCELS